MQTGKKRRLKRMFREDGRAVIVPMDHGVTVGPVAGLVDMQETTDQLLKGGADAILVHKGIARVIDAGRAGLIVHLSASTQLCPDSNCKVQVCTVEEALRVGADAVSVHINVGAEREGEMLKKLARVADDCDRCSIPLLAMMYPRGPKIQSEHAPDVVAQAARLGAELGADIVKTNYTGDVATFKDVVRGCPVPVIIAGGPLVKTSQDLLKMVHDSLEAGASGISIGRNVFQHRSPFAMMKALSAIVHGHTPVEEALEILGEPQ